MCIEPCTVFNMYQHVRSQNRGHMQMVCENFKVKKSQGFFKTLIFHKKPNNLCNDFQLIWWACGVSYSISCNPEVQKDLFCVKHRVPFGEK